MPTMPMRLMIQMRKLTRSLYRPNASSVITKDHRHLSDSCMDSFFCLICFIGTLVNYLFEKSSLHPIRCYLGLRWIKLHYYILIYCTVSVHLLQLTRQQMLCSTQLTNTLKLFSMRPFGESRWLYMHYVAYCSRAKSNFILSCTLF